MDDLNHYIAYSILRWLINVEGNVTISDGVAVTEDGTHVDLRIAFVPRKEDNNELEMR